MVVMTVVLKAVTIAAVSVLVILLSSSNSCPCSPAFSVLTVQSSSRKLPVNARKNP